jgi:hypothetical protein
MAEFTTPITAFRFKNASMDLDDGRFMIWIQSFRR